MGKKFKPGILIYSCILCVDQALMVAPLLRLASCVLRATTATRLECPSPAASVQKATTVLRDRAPRGHNSMSAQWDIIARRSSFQDLVLYSL